MLNLIGVARAITEEEHLAHHAQDKVADASSNMPLGMLGGNMGSMMLGNFGWPMMVFGWVFGILTVVLLVLLIMWLIKQIQK